MLENNENNDLKENAQIDEEEAKRQFFEELKNKNMEETKKLEEKSKPKEGETAEGDSVNNESKEENVTDNIDNEDSTDNAEEKKEDRKNTKSSLALRKFKATLIDTAISGLISLAGVYLFDFILRLLLGYYVADFKGVYIIIFFIILILYPTVMQNLKIGRTFGQKFSNVQVQEGE